MTVRDARPDDIDAIARLEEACFSSPWSADLLSRQLTGPGKVFLAADCDGSLAGYMGLNYVLDEGYITNVCTAPEARRRGVATALISGMISRADALGLSFMTLEARVSNAPARKLYSGLGFVEVGIRPGYYEKPAEDAVLMTLYLK